MQHTGALVAGGGAGINNGERWEREDKKTNYLLYQKRTRLMVKR
jgi:hypothetical protein